MYAPGQSTAARRWRAPILSAIAAIGLIAPAVASAADRTEIVSRGDSGLAARSTFGNGASTTPAISSDGRYVTFQSKATNLANPAGTATVDNVYRRDMETGAVQLVSVSCLAETYCRAASAQVADAVLSADGRYVAFTAAGQMLPGETTATHSIYRRDMETGTTERVTVDGEATTADRKLAISGDGRWVAYTSRLLPDDTTAARGQIILRDMTLAHDAPGARRVVSQAPDGAPGNAVSYHPSFSTDGRSLAFATQATNLDDLSDQAMDSIFVATLVDGSLERVSVTADGEPVAAPPSTATQPSMLSANGRRVLFVSKDERLKPDGVDGLAPTSSQLYVRDLDSDTIEPVSLDPATGRWAASASIAAISGDGRSVAFAAQSSLAPLEDETTARGAVFVRRLDGGPLERVSLGANGEIPDANAVRPQISGDGRYVAFDSAATNLLPAGSFGNQVFRRDTAGPDDEPGGGDDGTTEPPGEAPYGPLLTTTTTFPAVPGTAGRSATLEQGRVDLRRTGSSSVAKRLRGAGVKVSTTGGATTRGGRSRFTVRSGSVLRAAELRTGGALRFQRRVAGKTRTLRLTDLRTTVGTTTRVTAKLGGQRVTAFVASKVSGRVVDPVGGRVAVGGELRLTAALARELRLRLRASAIRPGSYGQLTVRATGTPSVPGTPAILGWTTTVTAPGPVPAPATPAPETPGTEQPITSVGEARWAFNADFRRYVGAGDGNPPLQATDGATNDVANDTFVFTTTEGTYDAASRSGRIVNRGTVVFDYPGHYFKITIADPTLVIEGETGYLEAYGQASLYGAEGEGKRVRLAELDLSAAERVVSGRKVSISGITATLTAEAAPLFAGFWQPGHPLAPLSFAAEIG